MPPPRISAPRKLLFSAAVVAGALALAEAGTRLCWDEARLDPEGRLSGDPRVRWTLAPSTEGTFGGVRVPINSLGYRGPELPRRKGRCTYRLYAAGDSSVFGDGVPLGQAFVERLPALLQGRLAPALRMESVNGAVPGFSTYQSLARLAHGGWALQPDLLIIGNLWSDAASTNEPDRLFFAAPPGVLPGALLALSRAAEGLTLYRALRQRAFAPRQVDLLGNSEGRHRRVPPREYAHNLQRMVDQARRRGARPLLLLLPHPTDQGRRPEAGAGVAPRPSGQGPVRELEHAHRQVMRRLARRTGTPLLDMSVRVAAVREELFWDQLHPNARGHALMAMELARLILTHKEAFTVTRPGCPAPP